MKKIILAALAVVATLAVSARAKDKPYKLNIPLGLSANALVVPDDNPMTEAKVELGHQLFFDNRWGKKSAISCASCHLPDHGWSDPRQFSLNTEGKPTPRHSPTVINRAFADIQKWNGASKSIDELSGHLPFMDPAEQVKALSGVRSYRRQFKKVFGSEVTSENVAKAIAAYVRTIMSGNSAYDRFQAGDKSALSDSAQRGLALFEGKANCVQCHAGPNFSDEGFRNIGVGMDKNPALAGRSEVTKKDADIGAFKTPTLRDVAKRGPYMHDGSLATLDDVIAFYDKGGNPNPHLAPEIKPLGLSDGEKADLKAFLVSLNGDIDPATSKVPRLP